MGTMILNDRPIIRRPINPMDRTTIVSIFPKIVKDDKLTIYPGLHIIPAAPSNKYSILTVGPGSWFKDMEEGSPALEIQTGSLDIANSIVNDFKSSMLCSNGADKAPGLFVIPGAFKNPKDIEDWVNEFDSSDTFKTRLAFARESQKNWFAELVLIADSDWAVSNGNPRAINDLSRLGAMELGLGDKPWLQDFKQSSLDPCPSCGELVNLDYPVCKNCKAVINKKKAEELGIVFALNLAGMK